MVVAVAEDVESSGRWEQVCIAWKCLFGLPVRPLLGLHVIHQEKLDTSTVQRAYKRTDFVKDCYLKEPSRLEPGEKECMKP